VRFFVTVNGVNRIKSDFTIRYNRLLRRYPGVRVNRNPRIRFMGVYKVKGYNASFKPGMLTSADTTFCLFAEGGVVDRAVMGAASNIRYTDTIPIDLGYSYYVATDSGIFNGVDERDTAQGLDFGIQSGELALDTTPEPENYFQRWFYELDAAEQGNHDPNDLFIITNPQGVVAPMLPALTSDITQATLWVQLYDYFLGEWNRPNASTLLERTLHFQYTPAYIDSIAGL